MFARSQRQQVLDQWYATQQRNVTLGLPVLPLSQVYTVDLLKSNGFYEEEIMQHDRTVADYNARLASVRSVGAPVDRLGAPQAASPRAHSVDTDVGGVKMQVNEPDMEHADLSPLWQRVLNTRRGSHNLSSDLP